MNCPEPSGGTPGLPGRERQRPDFPKPSRPSLTPSFVPASQQISRVMTNVESPAPHLGWHSRGYVPHWDHPGMIQSLNFRLHDSVPREVLEKWKQELGLPQGLA